MGADALRRAAARVVFAAALFGAMTPAAKWLLGSIEPFLLAGLLYLGAGVMLSVRRLWVHRPSGLRRGDLGWLVAAIGTGGVVAPVMLLLGLSRVPAAAAALLLNFEGVFTVLLAGVLFSEPVGRRVLGAVALLASGGALLAAGGTSGGGLLGMAAILAAALAWGLDNNFTREIAGADPHAIVLWKGLVAGVVNLAVGLSLGSALPPLLPAAAALIAGGLGTGLSLILYVGGLRDLGASRTAALFATAPFFGAALGVLALPEPFTATLAGAGFLMGLGAWLVVSESHVHRHHHPDVEHVHLHVHDEHHQHDHLGGEGPEPHIHRHHHPERVHEHPHAPDLHHRHEHR